MEKKPKERAGEQSLAPYPKAMAAGCIFLDLNVNTIVKPLREGNLGYNDGRN